VNDAGLDGADPARPANRWQHLNTDLGFVARELLPPYAVDTRCVGDLALSLGCGLGLSVPVIRSVPSPAAAQLRSLVLEGRGQYHSWLRGQGEVLMCVLSTHSMAMTCTAVGLVRARHGAAGGVSGGCDGWDVRTPLHAFFERSLVLQAPPKPQRRCLALLPWWVYHLNRSLTRSRQRCV
jgi:hypothetical protein